MPLPLLPTPASAFLPHQGRMCCIDTLVHEEGDSAVAKVTLNPGHALVSGGMLDRAGFIELAAQTVGARQGYVKRKQGLPPGAGFLVGVQDFVFFKDAFTGDTLEIAAHLVGEFRGVSVIKTSVTRDGVELAAGKLKVFEFPANPGAE